MASNADIKQHISTRERAKWNKIITDYAAHLGAGGTENHRLADGTTPGFSTFDFTKEMHDKLVAIESGALNNPHPATHPWTMIDGLKKLANTASWVDLENIPQYVKDVENGTADAATVGGIRITISATAPANPKNNKEIWIDTDALVLKIYLNNSWQVIGAAFR